MNPVLPATPPLPSRAGIRPPGDVVRRGLAAGWRLLALTGALLAGGCAVSRDFPLPTASCEPERVADIAITMVRNVPIATVTINGKPARMVIDSGADRSLLTPEAAARLGVRGDPLRSAMSRGIGGSTLNGGFVADTMEAGGLTLDGPTFGTAIIHWAFAGGADGFIGSALLSRFEVDLDFAHGHLGLYRTRTCPGAVPAWDGEQRRVALTRADSDHDLYGVPVRLDTAAVVAILDTGAEYTAVSPRLAARLGVSGPVAGTDRATRVSGLGGNLAQAFVHTFPSMTVAGLMAREPRLTVVDLPAPAMMLLGMDWLRQNRVWLAYATGHMFVRRN